MMRLRHISAWLLLVAFAAGGVSAPVLHQIQHGVEQAAADAKEPCHASAVHNAESTVWTDEGSDLLAPDCNLCATRLLVVLPALEPSSSLRDLATSTVLLPSHVAPVHVVMDRTIRGPPSLFVSPLA